MWKKIAIAGGVCAAMVGAGSAALATSGSSSTPGSPSAPSSTSGAKASPAGPAAKHKRHDALRRALHAQWVTKDKDGKAFVTHDAIRGTVTAVSPTSITVQAADKKSETFHVTSATKVRIRTNGKGAKGTISQVHTGEAAVVLGTGTTTLTAHGIVAGGK
jgi:hypothetical protein